MQTIMRDFEIIVNDRRDIQIGKLHENDRLIFINEYLLYAKSQYMVILN